MKKPTLHFMCGKPGAGKSTIAKKLSLTHTATLISEDIWLMRLFGDRLKTFNDYIFFSNKLRTVVGPLTTDLLRTGQSVVLDFPANSKASRLWFRLVFEDAGAAHALHFVNSSNKVCLQQIANRNLERPKGALYLSAERFEFISSFFEVPEDSEGLNVHTYLS